MSDTLEVNLPTYQMEPDPPRFPLRRLVKYLVFIVLAWGAYTYRVEIVDLAKRGMAEFDDSMPPPREMPPPMTPPVVPPATVPQPTSDITDKAIEMAEAGNIGHETGPGVKAGPVSLVVPTDEAYDEEEITEPSRARPVKPIGSPGKWLSYNDYPTAALKGNMEGAVSFRLKIDERGRAKSCRVTGRSGHTELDRSTCRLMLMKARFRPALDEDGRPVESEWGSRIVWKIEG